jgi:hypothetical protein
MRYRGAGSAAVAARIVGPPGVAAGGAATIARLGGPVGIAAGGGTVPAGISGSAGTAAGGLCSEVFLKHDREFGLHCKCPGLFPSNSRIIQCTPSGNPHYGRLIG